MNRRGFLLGLGAALVASPAVVRAASLMPIQTWVETLYGDGVHDDVLAIEAMIAGDVVKRPDGTFLKSLVADLDLPRANYRLSRSLMLRDYKRLYMNLNGSSLTLGDETAGYYFDCDRIGAMHVNCFHLRGGSRDGCELIGGGDQPALDYYRVQSAAFDRGSFSENVRTAGQSVHPMISGLRFDASGARRVLGSGEL